MKTLIVLVALLIAAPAWAQDRDTLKGGIKGVDVVRELAEQFPQEWSCTHREAPGCDPYAFVNRLASYIYYELKDTRVGLNRRRGDGDLSWDALAILDPAGDTTDINGARSFVIDFCGNCGTGSHNPMWASVGGRSGWKQPPFLEGTKPPPGGGGGGGGSTNPPPAVNLQQVLDAIKALSEALVASLVNQQAVLASLAGQIQEARGAAIDARNAAQDATVRIDKAHQDILIGIDLTKQVRECAWVGSTKAFGGSVTLRCQ
jgi:hypothetical protein